MNFYVNKKTVVAFIGVSVLMTLVGCSTHKVLVSNKNIVVERVDSDVARITRASLYSTETNKIMLRGELKKQVNLRGKIPGYLHVELVNLNGQVFKQAKFSYRRKNSKSQISLFSIPIPAESSLLRSVRITHHDISSHMDNSTKSSWQGVNTNK